MKMRKLVCSAIAIAGALAGTAPVVSQTVAESKLPQSSVSVLVEPSLRDGRLVVKVAAKNLGSSPVQFGPSRVTIAKPGGQAIAVYPLSKLVADVRLAAGLSDSTVPAPSPIQGAYSSPQMTARDGGQVDVTGFTGGSTIGGDEYVRRSRSPKRKPTISSAEADAQIAALRQAVLQDSAIAPGQIAAGQIVSEPLKFGKKEDRTLHLRIQLGSDQHGFTIAAPNE